MNKEENLSCGAERLRGISRRYRILCSVSRFFARLVWMATPGAVCILTAAFLSKILWPFLLYGLYLLPIWFVGLALYLWRQPDLWSVPRRRVDGLTDLRSGSRGTYMALQESGDPQWQGELIQAAAPRLRAPVPYQSIGVFVLVLGGAVTIPWLPDMRNSSPEVGSPATPVERTEELVELMEEAQLADKQYLEETEEMFADLRKQQREGLDAEDWQALDEVRKELRRQSGERWQRIQGARRDLEAVLGQVRKGRGPKPSQVRSLADALSELPRQQVEAGMKKLSNASEMSEEELRELLSRAREPEGRPLSRQQCEALGEVARACCEGGEGDGRKLKALKAAGFSEEELRKLAAGRRPGRGGLTRGPGAAPLKRLGETPGGGEFQTKDFRGNRGKLNAEIGSAMAPPDEPQDTGRAKVSRGPARSFHSNRGRIVWHSRLLPRHNDVLKNYFRQSPGPRDK